MNPELKEKLDAMRQSPYVIPGLVEQMASEAETLRQSEPVDSLHIYCVLAELANKGKAFSVSEKIFYLTKASDVGWQLNKPSWGIDQVCASLHAEKGKYDAAGHFYRLAAQAVSHEIKSGSMSPDNWQLEEALLRDAESHLARAGLSAAAADCHYRRMLLTRDKCSNRLERLKMWFLWGLWGWGERPGRVVLVAAGLIVLFALGYWAAGIGPNPGDRWANLGNSLYLSVVTFTTLGYGDYHPVNLFGKLLSAAESVSGIFFTGLFLVTFVKKYSG